MSTENVEVAQYIRQLSQQEGIKASANKVEQRVSYLAKDNYPKVNYSNNKRISFGGVWRK